MSFNEMLMKERLPLQEITVNNTKAMCSQKYCGMDATWFANLHIHLERNDMDVQITFCDQHKQQIEDEDVLIRCKRKSLGALFG